MTWGQPFRPLDDTELSVLSKQKPTLGADTLVDIHTL
jgi:hypothetical protein